MATSVTEGEGYLLIECSDGLLDDRELKDALDAIKQKQSHGKALVFDCRNVRQITPTALRSLARVAGSAAQDEAVMAVVASPELTLFIRDQGLERLLVCYPDLTAALRGTGRMPPANRTTEFLNTILDAIRHTLGVMASTQATAGKSTIRSGPSKSSPDVAGVIGIVSAPFNGALVLAFPKATYLGIMSRMLGASYTEITEDIQDGAAELLNMILGQAKVDLNKHGYEIKQAIPTVIRGKDVQLSTASGKPSIVVPYTTDVGDFYVELTVNTSIRA